MSHRATENETRLRILTAAAHAFLERGFEQSSTAEIARRAKVSKRELYVHFEDKNALLTAVVRAHQSVLHERVEALLASPADMATVLTQSAMALRGFMLTEQFGKLMRLVVAASFHSPELAKQFYNSGPGRGRKALARFLKKKMNEGLLCKANATRAADDFLNLVVGAHLTTAVILGQTDGLAAGDRDVRHALRSFLNLYRPEHTGERV